MEVIKDNDESYSCGSAKGDVLRKKLAECETFQKYYGSLIERIVKHYFLGVRPNR